MNVSYKRDMTHNYMIPEFGNDVSEEDYRIRMLMENHIQGLLPCSIRHIDCQSKFFYDITSRQSMDHIYGRSYMDAEDIRVLIRGLLRALREVKKYLLDTDRIVLEPEMIYMDIETREPLFCYLPGYQKDMMQSFRELSAYLLERLDRSDQQAVLLGYEIYRKAREENYSLEKILQEAGRPEEVPMRAAEQTYPKETYTVRDESYLQRQQTKELQTYKMEDWIQESERIEYEKPVKKHAEQTGQKTDDKEKHKANNKQKNLAKKSAQRKKKQTGQKSTTGRAFLIVCFLMALLLLLAAAWFWQLTVTQIGGILFLLVAIFAYGCSGETKKKSRKEKKGEREIQKAMEDFQEEPHYDEYLYEPRQVDRFAENVKYHTRPIVIDKKVKERYDFDEKKEAGRYVETKRAHRLGDTGVLFEERDLEPHMMLVSLDPRRGESILLEKEICIIGKLPLQADIVLDHPSVSRIHAKIERHGNEYYLCDLNSTNGTFLNGRRLAVNERVKIQPSDEIAFARMGYRVGKF